MGSGMLFLNVDEIRIFRCSVVAGKIKHRRQTGLVHDQHIATVGDDLTLERRLYPTRLRLQGYPIPVMGPRSRAVGQGLHILQFIIS